MIKLRNKNYSFRPEVDVGDIWELVGCKMFTRKLLKVKWAQEPFPTAWGLIILIFMIEI